MKPFIVENENISLSGIHCSASKDTNVRSSKGINWEFPSLKTTQLESPTFSSADSIVLFTGLNLNTASAISLFEIPAKIIFKNWMLWLNPYFDLLNFKSPNGPKGSDLDYIFFTFNTCQATFICSILWCDCKNWKNRSVTYRHTEGLTDVKSEIVIRCK